MIAATHIALSTGRLDETTAEVSSLRFLVSAGSQHEDTTSSVVKRLHSDKKTRQGVVHFILPTKLEGRGRRRCAATAVRSAVDEIRRLGLK